MQNSKRKIQAVNGFRIAFRWRIPFFAQVSDGMAVELSLTPCFSWVKKAATNIRTALAVYAAIKPLKRLCDPLALSKAPLKSGSA
ncbi:MAG TPA: hypothetical protein VGI88_11070, partial [Verrucomicrobiae bacterium]